MLDKAFAVLVCIFSFVAVLLMVLLVPQLIWL